MNCYTQDSLQSQMHKWECLVVDIINNKMAHWCLVLFWKKNWQFEQKRANNRKHKSYNKCY